MPWKIVKRKAAFWPDWNVFALAFSVIANRWAMEFRNFELILAPVIGCISDRRAIRS